MPDTHGTAAFATRAQLQAAGMHNAGGLMLGTHGGNWLYHHGDSHLLTCAPHGAGKSAALVVNNLLHYTGSAVVTDPKGTLTAMTARYRRDDLGQGVVVLNPWRAEMTEALGQDLGDSGFNPLYLLRDDASLHDNAKLLGQLLCPTPPDVRDPYFPDAARSILTGVLMYLVKTPGPVTLPRLAKIVRDSPDGWRGIAAKMLEHGRVLAEYAGEIAGIIDADRQWSGVLGQIHTATALYRTGDPLGDHVSRNQFDPADLKRQNMTAYLVIPSNRRDANKNWLGLVMALMAEAIGRPGPAREVLLLCEEFGNLGYMPTISRSMAEYREAGLKVWIFLQSLKMLHRIYGRDGGDELLHHCETKQFFGVDDFETARLISNTIGYRTVQSRGTSDGFSGGGWSSSQSTSETGVPLMRPEDVLNLPHDTQIILRRGPVPPILAKLAPYYRDRGLWDRAAANPYRGDKGPAPAPAAAKPRNSFAELPPGEQVAAVLLMLAIIGGALLILWENPALLSVLLAAAAVGGTIGYAVRRRRLARNS